MSIKLIFFLLICFADALCYHLQGQADAAGTSNPMRLPNDARQVMRSRAASMQLHPSFNRKFRSPFTSMASWQIEDCSRALQCFLPMIFRPIKRTGQQPEDVLKPELAKVAFGHLKRFAAFHIGHVTYSNLAEYTMAAKQATDELLCYGTLVEQVRGSVDNKKGWGCAIGFFE
jgi:hypothetical protein